MTDDARDNAVELAERDALILSHLYLVDSIVRRLPYEIIRHWGADELCSFGRLGLIDAASRRKNVPDGVSFATFAVRRVRGSIYDELRRLDWLPRTLRRQVIEYRDTEDALRASHGHTPTQQAIVAEMGLTSEKQTSLLVEAIGVQQLDSLQESLTGDDENTRLGRLVAPDDPEEAVLEQFDREQLKLAMRQLPDRQRTILSYRFLGGLTQQQVGEVLGVSNTRICQLQGEALCALRRLLTSRAA